MKKQLLKSALIALAGVGLLAGSALATSYCGNCCDTDCQYGEETDFITVDNANKIITTVSPYTNSFNLDNETSMGPEDLITSAFLTFHLYSADSATEGADFTYDGIAKTWNSSGGGTNWNPFFNVLGSVGEDHSITYTVESAYGNFFLRGVSLRGEFCDVNPIPEPTTMLLFGTGIAGLAGIARRRKAIK